MDQRLLERVWVGYFLSHRTLKIPSSIKKPVPGSKIVRKWSEKKGEILNHVWLVKTFNCISHMDYHVNTCFSPVQTDAFLPRVHLMLWISYRNFSFHNAIRFRPVEHIATRSLPHSKRLDNMEHFVTSQLLEVATCFLRLQINLFVTTFF